jgi:type IV pilus assembly protein PilC
MNAYTYEAIGRDGASTNGVVFAPDSDLAHFRLRELGFNQSDLRFNFGETIKARSGRKDYAARAMLYRLLAEQIESGNAHVTALQYATEAIEDKRLAMTTRVAAIALSSGGHSLGDALLLGGLPADDALLLSSVETAGRLQYGLVALAEQYEMLARLDSELRMAVVQPMIICVVAVLMVIFAIYYQFPATEKFLAQTGTKRHTLPIVAIYLMNAAAFVRNNNAVGIVLLVGSLLGLYYVWSKQLLLKFFGWVTPSTRELDQKAELLRLFGMLRALFSSGAPHYETLQRVAAAASTKRTAYMFEAAATDVQSTGNFVEAMVNAGFPPRVVPLLRVMTPGSEAKAIERLVKTLDSELRRLTEKLKTTYNILGLLVGAVVITGLLYLAFALPLSISIKAINK